MTKRDLNSAQKDLLPTFESGLFEDEPNRQFAVGKIALADVAVSGREVEYQKYYDLRRQVYVDETGQLDESIVDRDGLERDDDDRRCAAFGMYENMGEGQVRAVGALRLIMKGVVEGPNNPVSNSPLPIENYFPELFESQPAQAGATEVSRLIARHPEALTQEKIAWQLYATGLGYIAEHNLGPVYGIIEPWLEKHFTSSVPAYRIGEPRYIDHYQDFNLPIEVDIPEFMRRVEDLTPGMLGVIRRNEDVMLLTGHRDNSSGVNDHA